MTLQRRRQFPVGHIIDHGSAHDHDVHCGQSMLSRAKTLPHEALDTVSLGGAAGALSGNCQTKPSMLALVNSRQDGKGKAIGSDCAFEDPAELSGVSELNAAPKALVCRDAGQ
jgi:hypothetical protein